LQQRESPPANGIFPWARGVVGEWPFWYSIGGVRYLSPSTTTTFPSLSLSLCLISNLYYKTKRTQKKIGKNHKKKIREK
jgi:hypothetical protein